MLIQIALCVCVCVLPAKSSLEEAMRGELLPGSIFRDNLQNKQFH